MRGLSIIITYIVACLIYIFWSDALVFYLAPDLEQTRQLQTIKGTIFVLVTGALLAFLMYRHNRKQDEARETVERALQESKRLSARLQEAIDSGQMSQQALQTQSEALKRSNDDLVQFAYVVSHDLQEPLRMVSSYLQLLQRRYEGQLDDDADEFIHFAVDGAARMQAQIRSLLDYSRLNTHGQEFSQVDLNQVLQDVQQNLILSIEEKVVNLEVGELPEVEGDPAQLSILFQNLLSNGIKHGGANESPQIKVYSSDAGNHYLLTVEDNGSGFDPKFAERIFEIFQRLSRDADGTGIGLALCRRIVERHGGKIWAETSPGQGTKISFTLPKPG